MGGGSEIAAFSKAGRTPLLRYEALRNRPSGANYKHGGFMGLRGKCNSAIWPAVLLIANKICGVDTAPLVLMGGARGAVVCIYQGKGAACAPQIFHRRHTGV